MTNLRPETVTSLRAVQQVGAALLCLSFAVLLSTGAWLWQNYRPDPEHPGFADRSHLESEHDQVRLVRSIHRVAARTLIASAVLTSISTATLAARRRRLRSIATAAAFIAISLGASFSGLLLRWDQLSLRRVQVGTDLPGIAVAWSDSVRFVVMDGTRIASDTFRTWAYVHVAALPLLLAGCTYALSTLRRDRDEGEDRADTAIPLDA